MRRAGLVLLLLLLLSGCAAEREVVGYWKSEETSSYYFRLNDDGTCVMFNDADEWVSSGTYIADETHISFDTDTGAFVWAWDEEEKAMCFDANGTRMYYRLQE